MKRNQKSLAQQVGKSEAFISYILSGNRRPSWATAKQLAIATDTDPILWLEGTPGEIRSALKSNVDSTLYAKLTDCQENNEG